MQDFTGLKSRSFFHGVALLWNNQQHYCSPPRLERHKCEELGLRASAATDGLAGWQCAICLVYVYIYVHYV